MLWKVFTRIASGSSLSENGFLASAPVETPATPTETVCLSYLLYLCYLCLQAIYLQTHSANAQRPTAGDLTTYSDCDQALRYECVDRGSVMGPTDARYGPSGQRLSAAVSSSNDILPGKACSPLGQVTVGLLPGTLATAGQRTPQGAPVRYTG